MATDASTQLNLNNSSGDTLDESSVVQSDGATTVKRARVDVGFGADDERGRLVARENPLPVDSTEVLMEIAEELRNIKELLMLFMEV